MQAIAQGRDYLVPKWITPHSVLIKDAREESLWAFLKQTISVVLNHAARKIVIRGLVYWHFPGPRIAVPFFINEILTHKLEDMPKKYSG